MVDSIPDNKGMVMEAVRTKIRVLSELPGFERVRFIMLYGSALTMGTGSDIDLCIYFEGKIGRAHV